MAFVFDIKHNLQLVYYDKKTLERLGPKNAELMKRMINDAVEEYNAVYVKEEKSNMPLLTC